MIEFALSVSLLWILFAGVYQFGYAFSMYNRLQMNVYNAAMYASETVYDASNPARFETAIKNMAVYGTVAGGTKPAVPGLSPSNVVITLNPVAGLPTVVTVQIRNFKIASVFSDYFLKDKPRVTTLFIGQVTCSSC